MLEEIREDDDPHQRAAELRAEAKREALNAHSQRYAWELFNVWWEILEALDDSDGDT
jgi:hypothetical protein